MAVKNEKRRRTSRKGRVWEVTYTLIKDIPEKKAKGRAKPARGKAKANKAKGKAKPTKKRKSNTGKGKS